jgi:hypothetical protein
MIRTGLIVLVCLAALFFFVHYVPFQAPSFAFYAGFGLLAVGGLSVLRPLKFFGIRSRKAGSVLLTAGVVVAAAALFWPAPTVQASGPHQRLDDIMPSYSFYERHETRVKATPDRVARAVQDVRMSDLPVAVLLMRIRGMAAGRFHATPPSTKPILAGFLALDATRRDEYVGGMIIPVGTTGFQPRVTTPEGFLSLTQPGVVKVAFNMRWVDEGNGYTRLTTETRCSGTDARAQRSFARYWRVIYPGSAIIRRVWLDTIARKAQE